MARARVVLVRPEHPANVGAVARVILNTGLAGLDLVSPADWRTVECWRTAWGATGVLEQAREWVSLKAALAGTGYVLGLSRRALAGVPLDIRDAAAEISRLPEGTTAALVFGPETAGLTLDELALCGRTAFIPSDPAQPSLNLSHAVMIAAHEVFRAGHAWRVPSPAAAAPATHAEKERALALLLDGLQAVRALGPARRGVYARLWRGLIQRVDLSAREARLLGHLGRKLARNSTGPQRPAAVAEPPASEVSEAGEAGGTPAAPVVDPEQQPFADVLPVPGGVSIPVLKWRELLFTGVLRREGSPYVRDPARPLPPFAQGGLFPAGVPLRAVVRGGRVEVTWR